MIRILCGIIFLMVSQSVSAQDSLYFKDLYGFEDSNGQTHLYYQQVDRYNVQGDTVNNDWGSGYRLSVDLRHLNASTGNDTVLHSFKSDHYSSTQVLTYSRTIKDLEMLSDDPGQVVLGGSYADFEPYSYLYFVKGGRSLIKHMNPISYLFKSTTMSDSLFLNMEFYRDTRTHGFVKISADVSQDELDLLDYGSYNNVRDAFQVHEEYFMAGISPFEDDVVFLLGEGGMYKGILNSDEYKLVHAENNGTFHFDSDSTHIYTSGGDRVFRSDAFGDAGSWENITANFPNVRDRLTYHGDSIAVNNIHLRKKRSGHLYAFSPLSNLLYVSGDYGNTFSLHTTFDHTIQGVYHKPGTDSLYVLTIKDLFLIEGENQTLVDEVPLSAEDNELPNLPSSITLHQNYPNPFNPETTIRFELNEAAQVQIDLYDITGRHVMRLMNQRKAAGRHRIVFHAENVSSGVYFYRLRTPNTSITRQMTVVK